MKLEDSLQIISFTYDLEVALLRVQSLEHVIYVWVALNLDLVLKLIYILLKLPVL